MQRGVASPPPVQSPWCSQRSAPEARSKAIACAQAMLTCTVEASTAGVPAPLGSSFAQASAPSLPRTAYSVVPEPEPVR